MRTKVGGVTLALAALAPAAACGGNGPGPLAWPKNAGTSAVSAPVKKGQFLLTSIPLGPLTGKKPAVLLAVRPEHSRDARGVTLRYAASRGRGLHLGSARGWNARRWDLRPLARFSIQPHERAAVVVGASAHRRGVYFVRSFVVEYRIGGKRYRAPQQLGLRICVAMASCPH